MYTYAQYAKMSPKMLKIVAVAEPVEAKRKKIQAEHGIPDSAAFTSWEYAFDKIPPVDAVIIATQDQMHTAPLLKSMAADLHILCEKPIVPTLEECRSIAKQALSFNKVFMTGYVLKYTPFFSKIKELLDSGAIGRLIGIDHVENVGHIHLSHSFVRGNWRNLAESSPMILAKSCHDMDILAWLAGDSCESLSSYGALHYFTAANAPKNAPKRCLDGCPHMLECPYHVSKIYLTENTNWPVNIITTDLSMQGRLAALETGPSGRCVFYCDNDVVDHQTVAIKFQNGVMANFTMSGFTMGTHRNITLFGTGGEIRGDMEENHIELKQFSSRHTSIFELAGADGGHGGGDTGLITDFVRMVRDRNGNGRAAISSAFESHYMALAAEHSRLDGGKSVLMKGWREEVSS
jgi:predicted dehydrogenase